MILKEYPRLGLRIQAWSPGKVEVRSQLKKNQTVLAEVC